MSATVEDLETILKDPQHATDAKECLNRALERSFCMYEELKSANLDSSELSMTLLLLGASGAMIAVAGDKTLELKKVALENALTFVALHVKDFIEYETREFNA